MGVRGLETFMKKEVANGTSSVDMVKMIQSYKEATGQRALIIVDVEGMLQRSVLF